MLQRFDLKRFVWEKTSTEILAEILIFFAIKMTYLNALLSFSIVILHFSAMRSLLSELSLFEFPLLRKSKGYTLDSGLSRGTDSRSKRKQVTRRMPAAPIPPQNYSTGLSAPFQLNSKPPN